MPDRTKTALIIGASRGLGLGLASELARRGWQVIATARASSPPDGLASAVAGSAGRMTTAIVDVDSTASLDVLVSGLRDRPLDLLFINAGVLGPKHQSVDATTPEELGALFTTNAVAPLRIARRLLPNVVEGGTIAFMSSLMGSVAENKSGGAELYRASKAALNSLTRSFVATTVRDRNVSVLTLHPGWVRTDMGGAEAPLSIAQSVTGMADVLEARHGRTHKYLDYNGSEIAW